jgi:hypothetical protein
MMAPVLGTRIAAENWFFAAKSPYFGGEEGIGRGGVSR